MTDKTDHQEALDAYELCIEAAADNHKSYVDDYRFSRMAEQWPEEVKRARSAPGQERPMLTINKLPAFGRQVVNDIRQNRPAIKVRPVDDAADIETALVMTGLIRNIEYSSDADVAYDTAAECAVYGGFGYFRIDIDYACDDNFEQDIKIKRIVNPLSVLEDPYSTQADSSDWNVAFICEQLTKAQFEAKYPNADPFSFSGMDAKISANWINGEEITVAEWWRRDEVEKTILRLSNRQVIPADQFEESRDLFDVMGVTVTGERTIKAYRVRQSILNGQEIIAAAGEKKTNLWAGKYIPIVPVYGDEINIEGKRYFRSMIHDAKDAQRQVNYWETTSTELVALAPRVPFIGAKGSFKTDQRWTTASSQNHPFIEYDVVPGAAPPARQSLDWGPAVGAMQESLRANDNLKAILGMYDASLGQRSNETSGRAINARQREGDTGNFHFVDNLSRAIRCAGRIIVDLIPKVYTKERIVRVLGEDGQAQNVRLGDRQAPEQDMPEPPETGEQGMVGVPMQAMAAQLRGDRPPPRIGALQGVFDLAAGKYDLHVEAGPSFTTQRQETAAQIGEFLRSFPQAAPIIGDLLVKNFDWKDSEEIARRLHKLLPPQLQEGGQSPEMQAAQQQMAEMAAEIQRLGQELEKQQVSSEGDKARAIADMDKNAVERDKTALARERLLIEEIQAREKIIVAQKELELAKAQVGAIQADTNTVESTNAAIATLTQAAAELARAAQLMQVNTAATKRKQATAQKVNGQWLLESVETPEIPVQ